MPRRSIVAVMLVLASCTPAGRDTATPPPRPASPSPSPSPSATPAPASPAPAFDASRAYATVVHLARDIGPREDSDASFREAADFLAATFSSYGYRVARQHVPVPAGSSVGYPVAAGETQNIVATPPGFDATKPHLLVGAHFDTVSHAPGAEDNATGVAGVVELARLARLTPTRMPVEWVAFGGEERRQKGSSGALFGSRYFLNALPKTERAALKGVVALDGLGQEPLVFVCSGGATRPALMNAFLSAAARLGVTAERRTVTRFFSDHTPFERAGFLVAWLWTGERSEVHTPRDTVRIVHEDALARTGRLSWETIRTLSL